MNTILLQFQQNSVHRRVSHPQQATPVRGVWQDNPAPPTAPLRTTQPAPQQSDHRTTLKNGHQTPVKHLNTHTKRKVQLNLWVRPEVKAEIERIAKREGLSISTTGEHFLETSVQQDMHAQHAALLEPIIEKAIRKQMRAFSNRLAVLLVRNLFSTEQTRSFTYNILTRQPGITDEKVNEIKTGSSNAARANITRVTPQLKTVIDAVQTWLEKGGEGSV